ncbi:MarR family winged helix-turn-helix transcriptional regulator [Arthrobacter glacialis]|uniref:MarR family transcriptional regulator n=1 Tax=Arthrobacter glacialis TaxID=1664 RepID=A0A2S3ZZA7_ARTGL|nr:MarR family transcriptional regulator [Arthrobacter glacialis]POH57394.1 MarR family transcriptional regulator [Arthrobacter glacialis]POH74359.1 MarR family transcriptional regulator [Arthrobacter glacialis]
MGTTENDLLLERQLCFGLSVASRSVIAAYKPVLSALGLTHPQYLVMLALWEQAPRKVKDIGSALLLESATLSPLLKRLEALGLITRGRDASDERALAIDLTPAGRALRDQALSVPGTMMARLGLDRDGAMALHSSMMALIEAATHNLEIADTSTAAVADN